MNIIQKLFVALAMTLALGSISSVAVAYEQGRKVFAPADAIDAVLAKIKEAEDAIDSGHEGKDIVPIVKQAMVYCKEINASDKVSANVSRGRNHLKAARKELKAEDQQVAKQHLKKAADKFKQIKGML